MFTSVAIVTHVQKSDENNRFYAQAELILAQDVSHARLELEDVNYSVHATVLMNAKAGRNAFDILVDRDDFCGDKSNLVPLSASEFRFSVIDSILAPFSVILPHSSAYYRCSWISQNGEATRNSSIKVWSIERVF
jgi:hypothetical protein